MKIQEEVAKLEKKNEEIMKECSMRSEENQKLEEIQKWWGANIVGNITNIKKRMFADDNVRTCLSREN